ncbi:hypothetical protein ACROYT_G026094 [Oculina patagonica]
MMIKNGVVLFVGLMLLASSVAGDQSSENQSVKVVPGGCKGDSCPQPKPNNSFRPFSCLDYLKKGATKCGIYKLYDTSGNSYPAYCDMQSEPGTAWTLVMSWSNSRRMLSPFRSTVLKVSAPVNENSHNWNMYRLSLTRMTSLQGHSTHWRATCSYPKHGVDYRDYVRGSFKDFNIVDFLGGGVCKKVEYINIRGHIGIHVTVPFWQVANHYFLHTDSSHTNCQFNAKSGAVSSEDNFGYYGTINPKFRCTEENHSTTQWWFGGHL